MHGGEEREANYHFHLEHCGWVGGWSSWRGGRERERARAAISISRKPKNGAEGKKEKMPKMTVGEEKSVERRRLLLPFLRADEGRINVYEESRKR